MKHILKKKIIQIQTFSLKKILPMAWCDNHIHSSENGISHSRMPCRCMLSALYQAPLTHWGRVTHICVGNLTIIGSGNGLSPDRRQAITWTNVGILLIGPLGTNFSEMLIEIHTFSFKKIHWKMSSGKWRPFCLGLNVLDRARDSLRQWINGWHRGAWNDMVQNSQ